MMGSIHQLQHHRTINVYSDKLAVLDEKVLIIAVAASSDGFYSTESVMYEIMESISSLMA